MAIESFATPYPVIFHDGEREHDKGHIGVHSVLTFKRCQSVLSQKVGIPTNQLSVVFVCRRSDNKRQKLPINESTNFNIILNQHNPKTEKDCHFLVSVKKSKKERKGSRRRSAEAESGDAENGEDGYISPKRDLSPDGHISKEAIDGESMTSQSPLMASEPGSPVVENLDTQPHTEETSQLSHETSPRSMLSGGGFSQPLKGSPQLERLASNGSHPSRVRSPPVAEFSGQHLIGKSAEGSPPAFHQRLAANASSDLKSSNEKVLLRRNQQANSVSPIVGWQNKDKLLGAVSSPQLDNMSMHVPARHPVGWLKSEVADGRPSILRNDQKWGAGQPFFQPAVASQPTEGLQERFSDPLLTRSPVLLQRNGILNINGPQTSPSLLQASRPLVFPPMDSMLLPRVSSGIPGLASGTNAALNLQQAQAHYLNLQAQQSEQMYLNLQALSKMRGVVRGLAQYDNGSSHKPSGVCQYCYKFQERKINPTPFHLCVHDRVTTGFRGPSPAGPIERPAKRVEAAA